MPEETECPSVFICYAHHDNENSDKSKQWLNRLMVHLAPLIQQKQVKVWSDNKVEVGDSWHSKIQKALDTVKAAVLLVSPSFLASSYIRNNELPVLLKNAKDKGVLIIPVIISPSLFEETKFKYPDPTEGPEEFSLASLQTANSQKRPLNSMQEHEQDEVLLAVARRLLSLVSPLGKPSPAQPETQMRVPPTLYTIEREPTGIRRTQSVTNALHALSQMMKEDAKVREAVVVFQTDFEAVSLQIDVLSAYKDLHDWLHTLQFQCYERMIAESNRFPDDEIARENLIDHELTLSDIIVAIESVAGRGSFSQIETAKMIQDLNGARSELLAAIDNMDKYRLHKSGSLIARVLNVYPTKFNTCLNVAAKALRLPNLVGAMALIRDALVQLNPDQDKVNQFTKGVQELRSLHTELTTLLWEHDQWQLADDELRLIHIQVKSEHFMEEVEASWPRLKEIVEPLYSKTTEAWAVNLKADGEKLESALAGQSPIKVKDYFRRFRRSAGLRFFEIDVKLKKLCSSLRSVGDPLVSVLRILE